MHKNAFHKFCSVFYNLFCTINTPSIIRHIQRITNFPKWLTNRDFVLIWRLIIHSSNMRHSLISLRIFTLITFSWCLIVEVLTLPFHIHHSHWYRRLPFWAVISSLSSKSSENTGRSAVCCQIPSQLTLLPSKRANAGISTGMSPAWQCWSGSHLPLCIFDHGSTGPELTSP